jgi:hypothetical protein
LKSVKWTKRSPITSLVKNTSGKFWSILFNNGVSK